MDTDRRVVEYVLHYAWQALRQGQKQAARAWAQRALSLDAQQEEPWLILAALACPRASLEYCREALKINPHSQAARQGFAEAQARLQAASQATAPAPVAAPPPAPPPAPPFSPPRRTRGQLRYQRGWGLLLIAPWLIGLAIFKLAPILATIGISFTDLSLVAPDQFQFVGVNNYSNLFKDPNLATAFFGTIKLALIVIPIQVIAAILLASLLSSEKLRLSNTLRVLFFIPSIIPSAAAMFMWQGFVNPRSGWLNPLLLNPLGLAKYVHFTTRGSTPSLLILSTFWSIGPGFLIILGAMQGIPTDIYEAALVDGASRLRRFFAITLPMISPAIFFTLILNLTALFGGAILMDRGNTFNSSLSSVDTYLYYILFNTFHLGSAASLAWIFFLFMLALVLVLFASSKRWVFFQDREG